MSSRPAPSAALVAANQRLYKLRTQCTADKQTRSVSVDASLTPVPDVPADPTKFPEHLGWHSSAVSQTLRPQDIDTDPPFTPDIPFSPEIPPENPRNQTQTALRKPLSLDLSQSVKVYPDIALAMLRQEQTAAGRLWLLLRHLDRKEGQGVLRIAILRQTLTTPKSKQRLCGWRQLRNLLRQGEGIYWQRDKHHVWLRSAGKVAAKLQVTHLNGRPVAVPVKHLLGSIGEARAYLYASFHAGRQPATERRSGQKPIARETLSTLTGLTAESQRGYERRVGVQVSANFVIGERHTTNNKEERLWQQGGGTFEFVDHRGGQGKPGSNYIAWQLPNSYTATLTHRPKGRQKRINRMLSDLFMQGMTGNEQRTIEKRYFGDGAGAVKAVGKQNRELTEVYWLDSRAQNGRLRLWHKAAGGV